MGEPDNVEEESETVVQGISNPNYAENHHDKKPLLNGHSNGKIANGYGTLSNGVALNETAGGNFIGML